MTEQDLWCYMFRVHESMYTDRYESFTFANLDIFTQHEHYSFLQKNFFNVNCENRR